MSTDLLSCSLETFKRSHAVAGGSLGEEDQLEACCITVFNPSNERGGPTASHSYLKHKAALGKLKLSLYLIGKQLFSVDLC